MTMEHLIAVARGDQPADLLLRNGKVVNVYSGEIMEMDIAVAAGHVAGFGPRSARDLGTPLIDPFMTLSFLALPVIPELKITDMGLVDVNRFEPIDLFLH